MTRAELILDRLRTTLDATHLELQDESHRHAGHAGARGGAGHFVVTVVSPRFTGLGRLARHRAVYEALGDLMGSEIHALSAETLTPDEWRAKGGRGPT
jgi:BolA protein